MANLINVERATVGYGTRTLLDAVSLGVEEGDQAVWESLPDEDPRAQVHDTYEWLGYLQESLVSALSR